VLDAIALGAVFLVSAAAGGTACWAVLWALLRAAANGGANGQTPDAPPPESPSRGDPLS
jgi:hypothetical protein